MAGCRLPEKTALQTSFRSTRPPISSQRRPALPNPFFCAASQSGHQKVWILQNTSSVIILQLLSMNQNVLRRTKSPFIKRHALVAALLCRARRALPIAAPPSEARIGTSRVAAIAPNRESGAIQVGGWHKGHLATPPDSTGLETIAAKFASRRGLLPTFRSVIFLMDKAIDCRDAALRKGIES